MAERGDASWRKQAGCNGWSAPPVGLKPKDMLMMPARLAMALQAEGWWLRAEIVWRKERPMPESVSDRPTKSHEMIYLLAKSEAYFYDAYAIREPVSGGSSSGSAGTVRRDPVGSHRPRRNPRSHGWVRELTETRNARDVWTMDVNPLVGEDHFAAFPEALPQRCIAAATSEAGVCADCGAPAERVVEKVKLLDGEPWTGAPPMKTTSKAAPSSAQGVSHARVTLSVRSVGWKSLCSCGAARMPATVLDPFCGSGTTGIAASVLGRSFVGIDLNPKYVAMARRRIASHGAPLLSREAGS
jgi:hypothetical protein